MANDVEFKARVAKVQKGELVDIEEIMVTSEFRKWCKKLLEKAGYDKAESAKVLTSEFLIDSMDVTDEHPQNILAILLTLLTSQFLSDSIEVNDEHLPNI